MGKKQPERVESGRVGKKPSKSVEDKNVGQGKRNQEQGEEELGNTSKVLRVSSGRAKRGGCGPPKASKKT